MSKRTCKTTCSFSALENVRSCTFMPRVGLPVEGYSLFVACSGPAGLIPWLVEARAVRCTKVSGWATFSRRLSRLFNLSSSSVLFHPDRMSVEDSTLPVMNSGNLEIPISPTSHEWLHSRNTECVSMLTSRRNPEDRNVNEV